MLSGSSCDNITKIGQDCIVTLNVAYQSAPASLPRYVVLSLIH